MTDENTGWRTMLEWTLTDNFFVYYLISVNLLFNAGLPQLFNYFWKI